MKRNDGENNKDNCISQFKMWSAVRLSDIFLYFSAAISDEMIIEPWYDFYDCVILRGDDDDFTTTVDIFNKYLDFISVR